MEKPNENGAAAVCGAVLPLKEEKVICDVCGHANPEHTAICKMCSNYLKGMTVK